MGIDARGYFVTKRALTDEEIAQIEADLKYVHKGLEPYSFSTLRGDSYFTDRCVEINFDLDRFYGTGYERGMNFPKHLVVLGWLKRRPYVEAVYYGGDCTPLNEIGEWDEKRERSETDRYLSVNQIPYRESFVDKKYEFFNI